MYTKFKQAQYRQNQIGTDFITCPSDQFTRVFINGQITSAQNFPQSQLFISYKIKIPKQWKVQINEQYKSLDLNQQELQQLNCLQSVTQSALPINQKNENSGIITKFYFCFPIDLQLLKKDDCSQWPLIHFQVFSKDNWERIRLHGCGFIKVPKAPGHYILQAQTWKPQIDKKTRVSQFFLGGIIKPKNLQSISLQQKLDTTDRLGPINRFNYKAISSGKVNMRLNIAIQSKSIKNDERIIYRDHKYSQQTQIKKKQISQNISSLVNTGGNFASRNTNANIQQRRLQ